MSVGKTHAEFPVLLKKLSIGYEPPTRPEQKNERDAHPPIGRVSQKGRVGARPALSEVLIPLIDVLDRD